MGMCAGRIGRRVGMLEKKPGTGMNTAGKWEEAAAVAYMLLVTGLSLIPMDAPTDDLPFLLAMRPELQNVLHIPMFMILAVLLLRVAAKRGWVGPGVLAFALAFGIFNEFLQGFVPGRYAGLTDVILNLAGILAGAWLFRAAAKSENMRIRRWICGGP